MLTPPRRAAQGPAATLTRLNVEDVLRAIALERAPGPVKVVAGWAFLGPARRLARQLESFDAEIAERGLSRASGTMLHRLVERLEVTGEAPREGALLVIANHPGLFDALALFTALDRADLNVVAFDREFLRALPNLAARMVAVPESGPRNGVLDAIIGRLRAGEVVVTFPAGTIEPDPGVRPDAVDSLAAWSRSTEALAARVPALAILPAVVADVHTARALDHHLTRLRRRPADQEWLAAVAELIFPALRTRCVRVALGEPTTDPARAAASVRALMGAMARGSARSRAGGSAGRRSRGGGSSSR